MNKRLTLNWARYKAKSLLQYRHAFRDKMEKRHARFWSSDDSKSIQKLSITLDTDLAELKKNVLWQRLLSNKLYAKTFAQRMGVSVAKLYWSGTDIDLFDFSAIPDDFLLKFSHGTGSKQVYAMKSGRNILDGKSYTIEQLKEISRSEIDKNPNRKIVVEQLLVDDAPEAGVPKDYKFFAFNGQIACIMVIDRVPKLVGYFDENWKPMHALQNDIYKVSSNIQKPSHFDQMVQEVKKLSKEYGIFVRLDFYNTPEGPVFGEFTPTPSLGRYFTNYGDRLLIKYWDEYCTDLI